MKKLFLFSLFSIVFIFSTKAFAAKAPMKFGKVTVEELEMDTYQLDPDAAAVVLCSYGYFDEESYSFTHLLRVKILKKEGFNLASRKFSVTGKSDVKGRTFNLVNGEILADKLSRESIFIEKITDSYSLVSVAMPNVKEGSVIDLQIKYNGFPTTWYFQENIPVAWSELRIEDPQYVNFRKNYFGYEGLHLNERSRWVAKDLPAFKEEPFMDSRENYITKFEFDVISISIPGYVYEEYAITWESLSEKLMESKYFGETLSTGSYLNKVAKQIKDECETREDLLKAAVDYIHENIEFNEENRLGSDALSLGTVYKEGIGNSAEINLTLIRLLDKLGLEVYPVVISTRDNGMLSPVFASIKRLNYVLAYVKVGDEFMLMDATEKFLPYYLIPEKCFNVSGRLVDEQKSVWVDLNTKYKDEEMVYYDLKLEEDMALTGKLSYRKKDYAAYNFRKEMENYNNQEEYVEDLHQKYPDVEILDAEIKNVDDIYQPVTEEYTVRITNQAYAMDNTVYLTLALFEQIDENPFKSETRKYPVSLDTPIQHSGIVKIALPENVSVEELPAPTRFALPDKAGSFTYSISHMNNMIMLNYKLCLNKTTFLQNEYDYLKAFYNEVIKKEAEPLVLTVNQTNENTNETGTN